MTGAELIQYALMVPVLGAAGILIGGRIGPNVRESITLLTAGILAVVVWSLIPDLMEGARPGMQLLERTRNKH